jgi:ribosome-binding protein aMBF1 (putative translation factor)
MDPVFAAAAAFYGERRVPQCKSCGEDADELVQVEVNGRKKRVCESCAEQANEQETIAQESEAVVQNMMGFKGRR